MCRKDEYLLFKSRVTTSNHSNFVFRKTLTEKNASENVICFSRLLHMLTNVGLSIETNSVDPIGITSDISKHVGPIFGPTLFVTFMEFLKSADDTVHYSITVFCHVCHFTHKGDFGFEV